MGVVALHLVCSYLVLKAQCMMLHFKEGRLLNQDALCGPKDVHSRVSTVRCSDHEMYTGCKN